MAKRSKKMQSRERGLDGFAGAARDYGEGDTSVLGFDVFQNFGTGLSWGRSSK